MRVATVVGARPQIIKAAAFSRALRARPGAREILIHTGQHYDPALSQAFFDELSIPAPAHHLGIGSGPHGAQTGRMLEALERALLAERPDVVVVFGDTNSTLAGALAAAKLGLPVAHVEAGLRAWDRAMPEEINRVLTDHASALLFAPTEAARQNLLREGIDAATIHLVGDIMLDVARFYAPQALSQSAILARLGLPEGAYALVTLHRAANTDDPARLGVIVGALERLAARAPLVIPLHPRTRAALADAGLLARLERVAQVTSPLGYLDMTRLTCGARLVVTDSGGLQKEAFFHRVPCAILRAQTEWVELVAAGWSALAPPTEVEALSASLERALEAGSPEGEPAALYGDGHSAERMVALL